VGCLEIKDDYVGEMLSVFILSAKYEELIALPKTCGVSHPYAWDVAIVVNQIPLPGYKVQAKYMVIYFIGVLVESAKSVDLVVPNVRN